MRVGIVGPGAVGLALASALDRTNQVTLLGRDPEQVGAIESSGLIARRPDGASVRAHPSITTDPTQLEAADVIVLAVKSYDTADAMGDIAPVVGSTPVLTVQNGFGNVERIASAAPHSPTLAATTTLGAVREAPDRVRIATFGHTTIGPAFEADQRVVESVAEAFTASGLSVEITTDVEGAIWEKALINAGINPISALARVPNGRLRSGPGKDLLVQTVEEAATVARAAGYGVTDPVGKTLAVVENSAENRSSMLRDLMAGNRTEIEALNGAIVARGEDLGVPVPVNRTLTALVRAGEGGRSHRNTEIDGDHCR
ncbi:MAG: ketopantoate reductase family protein [Halodesulfurarchaeum sp.]